MLRLRGAFNWLLLSAADGGWQECRGQGGPQESGAHLFLLVLLL